ncbi:MAG: hypothetical protein ACJAU2_000556 [Maribacter sp.]
MFFGFLSTSKLGENIVGIAKVYSESEVCDGALEIARKDKKVLQLLGELNPLSKLAILEGAHKYSDGYSTLNVTFDVIGAKHERKVRSKMDVIAHRNGEQWRYASIRIRIKKPADLKQTIQIVTEKK